MHGTQTNVSISKGYAQFENDVKMYGTQTGESTFKHNG